MRKTREILRLHFESQLSSRQIASFCNVCKGSIQRYLGRLKSAGLSWPLPADLDDVALERRLFPPPPRVSLQSRLLPDWGVIHTELKSRKNVTLQLLWEEPPIPMAMPTAPLAVVFDKASLSSVWWGFPQDVYQFERKPPRSTRPMKSSIFAMMGIALLLY
jgi:hypothetical protein